MLCADLARQKTTRNSGCGEGTYSFLLFLGKELEVSIDWDTFTDFDEAEFNGNTSKT